MSWYSILPPLIAILIVFWRKEVIMALLVAVASSEFLLALNGEGNTLFFTFINTIERVIEVASSPGNSRILIFSILIGALLAYIRESGGVAATVNLLMNKGVAKSKRQVGYLTMFSGIAVFIESNLSVLTSGILSRGLFDKFKMSRARLAYIIDSTSAPVCILILLNGWGAYVLGLLSNYEMEESAVSVLWGSIGYNFYAIIALLIVFYTITFDKVHGPLKQAEENFEQQETELAEEVKGSKARYMLIPLITLIGSMVGFMFWTGDGDIASGSGSKSVLYATILACVVAYFLMISSREFTHHKLVDIGFKGMGELLPLVSIVLLSLTLGASLKDLGTGVFVAGLVGDFLPIYLVVPVLFLTGAVISFTTGTSWGTFAILIPIGVPLIQALGLPPSLVIAAILGGGVFGDHCSPISDTSAVSAIASGCDLLTHVKTQMPYALFGGALTFIAYLVTSIIVL
ncbi:MULTISPECIES: Na+/H+ antiporter NhaC family protein [Pseudoalteromonas]|jgi:Na+/H+ antiporter NhaC|uniref:Na+/H+ antiporter NhaC family protein n=1 Tax=Pseudoalteromonas TaxID=53246 RepID=UPI000780F2DD|nr:MULTISPECIES: Na+/H+ antiporter NhaC family protein [Gammaproteobacteria]MCF7498416.1 sodium:proton antiporter [Pseudoalteromonas sp. L1]RZF92901.1 sodium:proton antiporter [Pseudoalteromonas sp. CO302Y]RZG09736.1 sodium:proton antiporter [Pseudoalteromonas sp. CO133X]